MLLQNPYRAEMQSVLFSFFFLSQFIKSKQCFNVQLVDSHTQAAREIVLEIEKRDGHTHTHTYP